MRERERFDASQSGHMPDSGPDGEDGELDRERADSAAFLSAADEAIRHALSGDSEGFLAAGRQRGGQ